MIFGVQWYLWLILLALCVFTVFVWRKALKTSKERRERLKKEAEIWKHDYELRQEFTVLTEEKIMNTPKNNLLHGAAMNIQVMLENEADMNSSFETLPIEKKYVYALEYFDEDSKKSLSTFFKNNGAPLTPMVSDALNAINCPEYAKLTDKMFPMYDEDSEVSIDYNKVTAVDSEFKDSFSSAALCDKAADYIRKNKSIFIN